MAGLATVVGADGATVVMGGGGVVRGTGCVATTGEVVAGVGMGGVGVGSVLLAGGVTVADVGGETGVGVGTGVVA